MINQKITVDLVPNNVIPQVNINQYDTGYENLFIAVTWQNSVYNIEEGTIVDIVGSKPNNTSFVENCSWVGNIVTVPITQDMTDIAGNVYCKLEIKKDDNQISTSPFIFKILFAPIQGDGEGDRPATNQEIEDLIGGLGL